MSFDPAMMMEEIGIAVHTGRCPRCGHSVIFRDDEDESQIVCPGCNAVWGVFGEW